MSDDFSDRTLNTEQWPVEQEGYAKVRPWWRLTPRGMLRVASYRFGFYRAPERVQMAVAWHAPRWLVYQCVNRAIAHATTGKLAYHDQHVPTVLAVEVFKSWDDPRGGDRWAKRYNERETRKLQRLIERKTGRRG